MRTICLVPCGKSKIWDKTPNAGPTAAKYVYIGKFARKCQAYAMVHHPCDWYIISAKHGFLAPDDIVLERYDVTFNDIKTAPIKPSELLHQAQERGLLSYDQVVVLGGRKYTDLIRQVFIGKVVITPLKGCHGIGEMMHRLSQMMIEQREV